MEALLISSKYLLQNDEQNNCDSCCLGICQLVRVADNKSLNKLIIANYIKTTREVNGIATENNRRKAT